MSLKEKIAEKTGIDTGKIPARFQIIGHVFLAKLFYLDKNEKKKFANAVIETLPYIKTVCEIKEVVGELRKPKIVKILGNGLETIHKEHGILYKLDASKIMFSKGNHDERKRLIGTLAGKTLVDMFAGIGYFSLGLAKECRKIYAIEKNPVAFMYLKENIKLNKIKNITAIKGDCRKIAARNIAEPFHGSDKLIAKSLCSKQIASFRYPRKITKSQSDLVKIEADCVLMGYFPNTQKYLPSAFRFFGKQGIIIYHNLYDRQDRIGPISDLEKAAKKAGYRIVSFKQRAVKEYNSRKDHVVCDVGVEKNIKQVVGRNS